MTLLNCAAVALLAAPVFADATLPGGNGLVAHEWGTFTSVAGPDGRSEMWMTLDGPAELPCFVHRLPFGGPKFAAGTVRMETPVLYFYSLQKMQIAVHADFHEGTFTESYPAARVSPESVLSRRMGQIDWDSVEITPAGPDQFPVTKNPSPYFAARQTDSAPLQVGTEREKLLFYRGIGYFNPTLSARMTGETQIEISNLGKAPIAAAIVFDRHGGKSAWTLVSPVENSAWVDTASLAGSVEELQQKLYDLLVQGGLYDKEAAAMIATWRNSWFEDGTRVIWLVPRSAVDEVLPLRVTPAPQSVARVFVGRTELLSPATRAELSAALASGDVAVLARYGRFLEPVLRQMAGTGNAGPAMARKAQEYVDGRVASLQRQYESPGCIE